MIIKQIIPFCHSLIKQAATIGDVVIDCTAGNGHDTLFLANLVGKTGAVYSFDMQKKAIDKTHERLFSAGALKQVNLIHACHSELKKHISCKHQQQAKAAVFNLGYLPGGDPLITTTAKTTINALKTLLSFMPKNSIVVLVVYPGHTEGRIESNALLKFCENISRKTASVIQYRLFNCQNTAPFVIALEIN